MIVVPRPGFEPGSRAFHAAPHGCSRGPHTWPGYTTGAPFKSLVKEYLRFTSPPEGTDELISHKINQRNDAKLAEVEGY